MKKLISIGAVLALTVSAAALSACSASGETAQDAAGDVSRDATAIHLSDSGVTVDGEAAPPPRTRRSITANDIVCYEAGQGFTYGAGAAEDEHTAQEAAAHTVVHITKPGAYVLNGALSAGQVAVDLGEDAKEDSEAVVTLVLNGVDVTCTVAPAVIFYNVYACGSDDADAATAGTNVVIADGAVNNVAGSYVARIYKSYTLSEDGTEVTDNKKLHKYDGAFYSKMSMNVDGGAMGSGVLNIQAENEGLDSELHLTINGGNINIVSGNDSNGYLVINGGAVTAMACGDSVDSGLDADMGIYIRGGTVTASGNMVDGIDASAQNYAVFSFAARQAGGGTYTLKNAAGDTVMEAAPANSFTYLVFSSPELEEGAYTLWSGETQLSGAAGTQAGGPGGGMMGGGMPQGEPPEGFDPDQTQRPDGQEPLKNGEMRPEGGRSGGFGGPAAAGDSSTAFAIQAGGSFFTDVAAAEEAA